MMSVVWERDSKIGTSLLGDRPYMLFEWRRKNSITYKPSDIELGLLRWPIVESLIDTLDEEMSLIGGMFTAGCWGGCLFSLHASVLSAGWAAMKLPEPVPVLTRALPAGWYLTAVLPLSTVSTAAAGVSVVFVTENIKGGLRNYTS